MSVPNFETLLLPVLRAIGSKPEISLAAIRRHVALDLDLSSGDLQETMAGGDKTFNNRANWAAVYFEKAGLAERVRRGVYRLNQDGIQLLKSGPKQVGYGTLRQYPSYVKWEKNGLQDSPRKSSSG